MNPGNDRGSVEDFIIDHGDELLETWLEDDKNWALFTSWLYSEKQELLRSNLFAEFRIRDSKERDKFNQWAVEEVTHKLHGGYDND